MSVIKRKNDPLGKDLPSGIADKVEISLNCWIEKRHPKLAGQDAPQTGSQQDAIFCQ